MSDDPTPKAPPVRLIYSMRLGTLRRGVLFDYVEEMSDPALTAGSGESQIDISRSEYDAIGRAVRDGEQVSAKDALQQIINRRTRRTAVPGVDDRFCVIDADGNILGALLGDPACGFEGAVFDHPMGGRILVSHSVHRFVHHPEADTNWRFDPERGFIAPPQAEESDAQL